MSVVPDKFLNNAPRTCGGFNGKRDIAMTVTIKDMTGARTLELDGTNAGSPNSVFMEMADGTCYEFDRGLFVHAVKREFRLLEALEIGAERLLRTVA